MTKEAESEFLIVLSKQARQSTYWEFHICAAVLMNDLAVVGV